MGGGGKGKEGDVRLVMALCGVGLAASRVGAVLVVGGYCRVSVGAWLGGARGGVRSGLRGDAGALLWGSLCDWVCRCVSV